MDNNNNKFQSAKRYADLTFELLTKYTIPPTPVNYSVLFLYTNGSNPQLNQQINLQLRILKKYLKVQKTKLQKDMMK